MASSRRRKFARNNSKNHWRITMPTLEFRRIARALIAILGAFPAIVFAEGIWSIDVGTEPSFVEVNDRDQTWWTNRIQATYRDSAVGGVFVAAESQTRESVTDPLFSAGGYRRLGDWTLIGQTGGSIDPDFVSQFFIEPQISRRLFGTFVGQAGYLYREFPQSHIHVGSLSGIQYFKKGEVELRTAYGKSLPLDRPIRVWTLRGLWDDGSAWAYGGTAAFGDNLFDAVNVPGAAGNRGWAVNINTRYRFDDRNSVRLDLTSGREEPAFRQHTLGLSYRRSF
ncbi:MAG: YaiO family outer membrane beta-barrel protein [Burkholderiales bacterium]|nr:YaiO family outer membrane beta-barrel protein [Burkholderiales bacterium]